MVDMAKLSAHHGSVAASERMKKRKFAEWRMQAMGLGAIMLAGLALLTLMSTVVGKAVGALSESYITLEIPLIAEDIDPDGTNDPKVIGKANFGGIVKSALKEKFPEFGGRKKRRLLYDIVSGGAAFELRDLVMGNPSMIGESATLRLLASDVSDLYLKGAFGTLGGQEHVGGLEIVVEDKTAQVLSSSEDFAAVLADVKSHLLEKARFSRRQAQFQENGVVEFQRLAGIEQDSEKKAQHLAQVTSRQAERDRLISIAVDLEARAAAEGGSEALDDGEPSVLIKAGGGWIKLTEVNANGGSGEVVSPFEATGSLLAKDWTYYIHDLPENARKISDEQIVIIETLKEQGAVETVFNTRFFSAGDSREPELAGIWGAAVGSFWTMMVTFLLAFPIGVMAAIYLEEFATKNRLTDFIEVNINNLAAVPSIVFGLLGLSVFLGVFGVPRSSPLAGGIVLALMTLPTIIIASRAAIRAVPPSIRDAALGLGASRLQTSVDHVFPLAMPGILTGTIIGMAQALGETAPLIMIGMVAFIVDIPTGITDSATVLPVQIYRWADFPERAFEARTAAAICSLLLFLILMNALAVFLRKRFERRW